MPKLLVPACVWPFCLAPQQRLPLWRRPGLSGSYPLPNGQPPFASVDILPSLLLRNLLLVLLCDPTTLLVVCDLLCKAPSCLPLSSPSVTLLAAPHRHLSEARTATAQRVRASRRGGVPADERRAAKQAAAALSQVRPTPAVMGRLLASAHALQLYRHSQSAGSRCLPWPSMHPKQTMFVHTDFLESTVEAGSLDTITCLR